jgi:hypothetical protein
MHRISTMVLGLSALVGLSGLHTAGADENPTRRFATACADCHEGECSGRLGFERNPELATTHIRNYAGPVSDALALELYAVLERMKGECRYQLPAAVDLLAGGLDADGLAATRDTWNGYYLIPIETLGAGNYRLNGTLAGDGRVRVEIVDALFDHWVDECAHSAGHRFAVELKLPERSRLFIRLRPADRQQVIGLSMQHVD